MKAKAALAHDDRRNPGPFAECHLGPGFNLFEACFLTRKGANSIITITTYHHYTRVAVAVLGESKKTNEADPSSPQGSEGRWCNNGTGSQL